MESSLDREIEVEATVVSIPTFVLAGFLLCCWIDGVNTFSTLGVSSNCSFSCTSSDVYGLE